MRLLALGLNHQTAPVAVRERLAIDDSGLPGALASLLRQEGVRGATILSTCNRTEAYCLLEGDRTHNDVAHWLARFGQLHHDQVEAYLYQHHDVGAVRHLFRVATGLDSMILGEPQILGQVKEAWRVARRQQAMPTPLDRLFQQTFAVAKRVRTDTHIGLHPVSVAFAAVRLAQRSFASLDRATVLLIGAGDTIELAARHLVDQGVRRLMITNRTLEHAQAMASRYGAIALPLDELPTHLDEADIIFSATASRTAVVRVDMVQAALRKRRRRPMLLLDLAVPRDIEPGVAELEDAFLYGVDDLEQAIDENLRTRREAAEQAEIIIDLQVQHYLGWWRAFSHQHTVKELRARGERTREEVLQHALALLQHGRSAPEALEYLAHTLTNKLLHAPSAALHQAARAGDHDLLGSARRLFDLPATNPERPDDPETDSPPQA